MPRELPTGLDELFARKDTRIRSHSTLHVHIDNGDILRDYRFASATLTIDGAEYAPQLRKSGRIKNSTTQAADTATVELQNADTELGKEFLALGDAIYGAEAEVGRFWRDLDSGATYHKVFLAGPVASLAMDQNAVRLTVVAEPYANFSVGPARKAELLCQWEFRNPNTCGYAGNLMTCNFMLNHDDGCKGRHGVTPTLERARFGGKPHIKSQSRLKIL